MAAATGAGQRVVVVTATSGERGTYDPERWPPARLARHRRREMAASLAAVGVREHHWLGYPDGGCADVAVEPGRRTARVDHRRRATGHDRHLRSRRHDRPPRPPRRVGVDDRGLAGARRRRTALVRHAAALVPRSDGAR